MSAKPPALRIKDLTPEQRAQMAEESLDAYEGGAKVSELAEKRQISPTSLYRLILKERPEDWRNVQTARVLHQLEEAKQQMKGARDHLELAKGEKLATRAAWELERLYSRMYGQKQEAELITPVQINIGIRRADEQAQGDVPEVVERMR